MVCTCSLYCLNVKACYCNISGDHFPGLKVKIHSSFVKCSGMQIFWIANCEDEWVFSERNTTTGSQILWQREQSELCCWSPVDLTQRTWHSQGKMECSQRLLGEGEALQTSLDPSDVRSSPEPSSWLRSRWILPKEWICYPTPLRRLSCTHKELPLLTDGGLPARQYVSVGQMHRTSSRSPSCLAAGHMPWWCLGLLGEFLARTQGERTDGCRFRMLPCMVTTFQENHFF